MGMHRMAWLAGVGSLSVVAAGCLGLFRVLERGPEAEEEGRARRWSGRSYVKETRIEVNPRASSTAAGFDAERVWSGYEDWEPAIAADPTSSWVYALTTRYGGPKACTNCADPALIFHSSSDGGATWNADTYLAVLPGAQNDPIIQVAQGGAINVLWLNGYRPGVTFIKSTDHGISWSRPVVFARAGAPKWNDKPALAISPDGKDVYAAFNASDSYVASSHNFGKTFADPVKTNSDQRYWFHTAGVVAPNGDVYFSAVDYSSDYSGPANINVLKSTDGGQSWQTLRIDVSSQPADCPWASGCYFGFLGPSEGIAVDVNGQLTIAYNMSFADGAPARMITRTSSDRGVTWSGRLELSNGDATVNSGFPAVVAGPKAGDFRVIWQDDRAQPTVSFNTWYRRTVDGGATWGPAVRISDVDSGAPYKTGTGFSFPYGDYLGMAVDANGVNHMLWGEGESYDGFGGTWYTRGL